LFLSLVFNSQTSLKFGTWGPAPGWENKLLDFMNNMDVSKLLKRRSKLCNGKMNKNQDTFGVPGPDIKYFNSLYLEVGLRKSVWCVS